MELNKRNNILVYGYGRTGKSVAEFLSEKGVNVTIYNDGDNYSNIDLKKLDFVVISPGVSLDNEFAKILKKKNIKIISELELGYQNVDGKIVAITGTNGKTTTTSLLYAIFQRHSQNSIVAGNIGQPLISYFSKTNKKTFISLEVSSFQLESCKNFKPKISAVLNFAPDHLDRHKTLNEYKRCKEKIFQNQNKKDFCVLNYDDAICKKMAKNCEVKKYYFSLKEKVKGCFVEDNRIFFSKNGKEKKLIMKTEDVLLLGEKNLENVLCAICISKLLKIPNKTIKQAVENFKPLKHRLEYVDKINGVTFINDSKATNIASTLADLTAFSCPVNLILGGSDKGENFDNLFKNLHYKVLNIISFGETTKKIKKSAEKYNYIIYEEKNLKSALKKAYSLAKKDYVVLFAPACASFDMFKNYEERGETFKKLVEEIKNGEI